MVKVCHCTTGIQLPPTHNCGQSPIDAVFSTSGLSCQLVTLLPNRAGVIDHRVFLVDVDSAALIGNVFPRVILLSGQLLNCTSDKIKNNYISILNQLTNRHLVFEKLLWIDNDSDNITPAQLQLWMNNVDLELEHFMKSAKKECHKYKRNNIEWSPYAGVWIHRRWLLARVHNILSGKTRDVRNLFQTCKWQGIKDPHRMTMDKLKLEFFVCKHNINLLAKKWSLLPHKCPQRTGRLHKEGRQLD